MKPKQKFYLLVFLLAIFLNLIPNQSYAFTIKAPTAQQPILVFNLEDKGYQNFLASLNAALTNNYNQKKSQQVADKKVELIQKVQTYLQTQKSPLAEYTPELISVTNWKKIVALSNAESSMCRNYPVTKANCWGVGGAQLWDLGNNLREGIMAMNSFLNQYPRRTAIKYSEMSFKQMNGLYKQPAAPHWLYNAQSVYDDLTAIEKSI